MQRRGLLLVVTLCLVHLGLSYETTEELPFGTSFLTPSNRAEYIKTVKEDRGRFLKGLYEQASESGKHSIIGEVVPKCYSWWLTEQQRAEIEALHLSGDHDTCKKRIRSFLDEQPEEKRKNIESYWEFCEHLWYTAHKHESGHGHHENHQHSHNHLRAARHVHTNFDDFAKEHLAWLTDEEKTELKTLHDGNQKEKGRARVLEILEASTGEKREKGIAALQGACRELITEVLGEEKAKEIKQMKESGSTNEQIGVKVTELLETVTNETLKNKALEHKAVCAKLYDMKTARRRRHVHTNFDDFAKEHLAWLTDEEKAEVKKLHDDNQKEKGRAKVMEILEASTGEKREKGIAALQGACRELITEVLGEEKAKEIKQMKESGLTNEEIGKKIGEFVDAVTNETLKTKALEHKATCARLYDLKSSKKRRNVQHHDLESKLRSEWDWLTDAQKEEIRQLKRDGKNDEVLLSKVFEYFKNADDKSKAEDGLQTSCGAAVLTILGVEKAEVLKNFMANGATPEAYEQKVKELLNEAPKKTLTKNQESCKLVFTGASRRRRHEGHHHKTLEDYLQTHLTWLTEVQKEELKQMKKDGKGEDEIQAKVMTFYEAATGETKEKATADLRGGCEEILAHVISAEQLAEIKRLRESGAAPNDVSAKVAEFAKTVTDEEKLKLAEKYKTNCKKLFGVTARRRRHEDGTHHHHTLEDYLESSHLSWLTASQKEAIRKLAQEGKSKEVMQQQVMEYYEATAGELREKATADLQSGCRELFTKLIGTEKSNQLKALKESGATNEELRKKGDQFVEEISDDKEKQEAKFHSVVCRKAFGVDSNRKRHTHSLRHRRDHHGEHHSLEELFKTYLSWLTEDQQKKLTELKAEGKTREDLQKQVLEYYEAAPDSVKETAREKMQDGCRKLLVKVLGQEKANELKQLRESGTPLQEIAEKTTKMIAELTDDTAKQSAKNYAVVCNKAFEIK